MNLTLRVWRQDTADAEGRLVTYPANDISPEMSFLEMLDVVNEGLNDAGKEPIAFDSDCREGICGMCSLMINGLPHSHRGSEASSMGPFDQLRVLTFAS